VPHATPGKPDAAKKRKAAGRNAPQGRDGDVTRMQACSAGIRVPAFSGSRHPQKDHATGRGCVESRENVKVQPVGGYGLMHDLFGADIRPWKDAPVWHSSVSAWELFDGDKLIGRFYLDMHPREGKYNHAAKFSVFIGAEGRTIPVATLVCNSPASGPMGSGNARTFCTNSDT
jgi:hypothetical protein